MHYNFRYRVDGNLEDLTDVLNWCKESFGEASDYNKQIKEVLAKQETNLKWTYLYSIDKDSLTLFFVDELDVTAFKLQWY